MTALPSGLSNADDNKDQMQSSAEIDLAKTTQELTLATQTLTAVTNQLLEVMQGVVTTSNSEPHEIEGVTDSGSSIRPDQASDKDGSLFARQEQIGNLVDVDASTDLSKLPPHITHIRHPDGSIERIGFDSSLYGA